jgi:primosomal protein N' (replication factor Y)
VSAHLAKNYQVMLFLNRRGYAPVLMCHACGHVFECNHCDARLVLHQKPYQLHCHHCGLNRSVPTECAQCQDRQLLTIGLGTERLEEVLAKHFPTTEIIRIDSDSTRKKGMLAEKLALAQKGLGQILIGTQMLAKGHDFPNLTLVAILDADGGFYGADFRNTERMGQMLLQVSGRAGRGDLPGEVVIQTRHPEHPLLQCVLNNDYAAFTAILLQERLQNKLPPYGHLALLRATAKEAELPLFFLQDLSKNLKPYLNKNIELLGPIPSPMARKAGHFRAQLLIQATQRKSLHDLLSHVTTIVENSASARNVRWSLDIDPLEMFA